METEPYLERIGFEGEVRHDAATLEALQRAHLTAVPFENLDVYHRRGVSTDADRSRTKIVDERRGGWCYELNGAFGSLLEDLGFVVLRLGATVLLGEPPGPFQPDHLAIRVDLDRPYLVDVGFGDSFIRPLPLDDPGPHQGGTGMFGFSMESGATTLYEGSGDDRVACYSFDPDANHTMDGFEPASRHLQAEPGRWIESPFATRLLDGGPDRVTLLRNRLKLRRNGILSEEPVAAGIWAETLDHWFGLDP